jgi:hypothetical protein
VLKRIAMSSEIDRRREHLANGGTLANYDRSHYELDNEDNA